MLSGYTSVSPDLMLLLAECVFFTGAFAVEADRLLSNDQDLPPSTTMN